MQKLNRFAAKLTALSLAFLFLLTPIAPVLANDESVGGAPQIIGSEVPLSDTPVPELGVTLQDDPTDLTPTELDPEAELSADDKAKEEKADDKEKEKDKKDKDDEEEEEVESMSASAPTTIDQAKVSNSSRVAIDVDHATGAFTYKYKLEIPPGRNNVNPILELQYNSEDKNNASEVGFGWSLSIPTIERVNKRGTDLLYSSTDFSSSLSGELNHISGNDYGAKVDDGSLLDYELASSIWTVTTKEGIVYTFGGVSDARLANPSDSTKIHTWYLTKIQDTNDNFISYTYYKDTTNNAVYPDSITYTNNGASAGIYEIDFTRETRPDAYISYAPGFLSKVVKRTTEIQIITNSSWTRKYVLGYEEGDNGYRSMLDSVTESGRDEASTTTTLPDMSMVYTTGENSLANNSDIDFPWPVWGSQETAPFSFADQYVRVLDVNGDGLKDIVKSFNVQVGGVDQPIFWVLVNNGHGWEQDTNWTQPTFSFVDGQQQTVEGKFVFTNQVDVGDWNGDGKDDLIKFWKEGADLQHAVVLLNNGSGWTQNEEISVDTPTYSNYCSSGNIYITSGNASLNDHFIDLNGDGLLDFVRASNSQVDGQNCSIFAVLYNQDGNLVWDENVTVPSVTYGGQTLPLSLSEHVKIFDMNGDGLVDFMWANSTPYFWILINNGHGWYQDTSWTHPTYDSGTYFVSSATGGWRPMEINGDGLSDLVKLWTVDGQPMKAILVNSGIGWEEDDSLLTVGQYTDNESNTGYPVTSVVGGVMFFDADGDGMDDIVRASFTQQGGVYYPINWFMNNTGYVANLVEEMHLPEGGSFEFTYKASSAYTDGSGNLLNPDLPTTYNTLESVTSDDGLGNTAVTNYEYAAGNYFYNNSYDRRFAGYGKITITDPTDSQTIIYNHVGNGLQSGETGSDPTDGSFIGKVYRTQRYNSSDVLAYENYTDWTGYDLGNGRDFVYTSKAVTNEDDKKTATEYTYSTSTGNLTSQTNYGKVTTSTNTFTDTGSDKRTTNYTYTTTGPTHVATVETLDQSDSRINQQKFYYDSQSLGTATDGNQTKVESWVTGSTYINSQKTYTSKGLVSTETDPRSKVTEYTYDSYDMYPVTVTNALDQDTDYTYNYGVGKAKQVTDANGFVYQTTYDGLSRIKEEKIPGESSPHTPVTKSSFAYTDTANAFAIHKTDNLDGSIAVETYQYLDGFGRIIQTRVEDEAGTYSVKDTVYNDLGLVDKECLPYTSSGSSKTTATTTTSLYTSYAHDALSRVTGVTNAIGTMTKAYDDWKTTVTDLRSKAKDFYADAYGNLVQVDEHNSSNTYTTAYEYDGNNKLTKITDALSNIRNFTYDGLGRRLTAQDLHASADATFGSWTYTYDNAGNLASVVNPNSQTINYTYDDINRQLTENYTGDAGTEVTYAHDSCTNGVGKLCTVTATGANDAYVYNSRGNISSHTKTINSTGYQTDYTYDRQANQLEITNPDSSKIQYAYNSAGQLETVKRKESTDGSFVNLVTDFDYGPDGQITYQAFTNGAATTNTYDATKLYRLTSKVTTIASSVHAQDLAYTYDNNGNITQIVDASTTDTSKTANYTYDDLNRMTQAAITSVASGQSTYTHNYTYDAIGNLLTRTDGAGTYSYVGSSGSIYANPHAVTSIGSTDYTYDNNGNLTNDETWTHNYDYHNRLIESDNGADDIIYAYDATGQRVLQDNGTTATIYPTKLFNTDGADITKTIFLPDGDMLATVSGSGASIVVNYIHTDNLGSSNVSTNSSNTISELLDYFPFGNIRIDDQTSANTQRKYIGQEYDADTGFNYLNARYSNSAIGRFINQDPVFWEVGQTSDGKAILSNPQAMNSYSYAGNNPITNKDPGGRFWWKEFYTDWNGYSVTNLSRDNGLLLKAGEVLGGRSTALNAIANNEENISNASQQTGINAGLIKSVIYEEQSHQFPPFGGEALVEKMIPNMFDGGIGIMQVSAQTSGLSNTNLLNSKVNINAGAGILKNLQDNGYATTKDVATRYNRQEGGPHAERYGARVDSYANNQTYTSNMDRALSGVSNLIGQVSQFISQFQSK